MAAPQAVPRRAVALPEENVHTPLKRARYLRHMRGLALASGIVVASLAAGAAASSPPGGGGRIVFASDRAPDLERTMFTAVAARNPARRSVLGRVAQGSVLAPDGRSYAAPTFTPSDGGRLLVGRLGAGGAKAVASSPYAIREPVWSPDGRTIAYEVVNPSSCGPADHSCVSFELWVVPAAGGQPRQLASAARFPVWSADSRRLAFVGRYGTYAGIGSPFVVSAAGGAPRRLSRASTEGGIAWAPRAERLAFPTEGGHVAVVSARGRDARSIARGRAVAWASARRLVLARPKAGLAVVRPDGRRVRAIPTLGGPVDALAASPDGGEVAYLARRGAKEGPAWIVAAVGVRGRHLRALLRVDRYGDVSAPVWSRDGSKVIVTTTRSDNDADLFTMRPDGGGVRRITNDAVFELDPALSPNGKVIVFTAPTSSAIPQSGVFAIRLDGRGRRALTTPPLGSEDLYPAWSRDGSHIAFVRTTQPAGFPATELWTVRADGTDARRLLVAERAIWGPTWSPDGSQIAFGRSDLGRPAIWLVRADGADPHELTAKGGLAAPAWSPDGSRLALVAAGTANLVVFELASGATRIAAGDAEWGSKPAWSPDGSRIAYLGTDRDVHSIASAGGDEQDLTPQPGREWGLDWSRSSG
jgi:Tol biopolymer transport system component